MSKPTIIVIGGGLIGLNTAYQLAVRDAGRVILLEKGSIGDGSSSRAAGIGTHHMWCESGIRAREIGFALFREFSDSWDDFTFHNERGCLNLFGSEGWPARAELLPLYDRLKVPYEILNAAEIRRRWPVLSPPADAIGLYDPRGGYSEPAELISALTRRLRSMGVEICEQEPVVDFLRRGDQVAGVQTDRRRVEAESVISTVHVWSLPLWKEVGYSVPIKHFVHQRYVSKPLKTLLEFPPVNADPYLGYVRTTANNQILMGVETPDRDEWKVSSPTFDMTEVTTSDEVREVGRSRLSELLPALKDVEWESEKIGLISFSYDGEPILGAVDRLPGLYVAASFHSGGYSYSAAAGYMMASIVMDGSPPIDVTPFSPNRFDPQLTTEHLAITLPQKGAIRRRH